MLYNIIFFYVCVALCFAGSALYVIHVWKREPALFSYSRQWIVVGVIAGALSFIIRYREMSYLPLVSLFEITFFYGWLLAVAYLVFVKEDMGRFIQALMLFIFNGIFFIDLFLEKKILPLNPLLDSWWLGVHVPAAMLSYSAFGLSFAVSLYIIAASFRGKDNDALDRLNGSLILAGVLLLGIGIVTGSIWARTAWGTYWSWDPKETWALITFIIYAVAALTRKVIKSKPVAQAYVSVGGFLAMCFTFFGVSLLLASHHAYK